MKKQRAKKAGGAKKKDEKADVPTETEPEASSTAAKAEEAEPAASEATETPKPSSAPVEEDEEPSELPTAKSAHGRKPSVAIESRQRSESFYRSGAAGTPTSAAPLSPGEGVTSGVYREQAQRIEELDKENKRLASQNDEYRERFSKAEEELEELREEKGDVAVAVAKGQEAEKLVRHVIFEIIHVLLLQQLLMCRVEIRSRIAKETIVTSTITKHKDHTPHLNSLA